MLPIKLWPLSPVHYCDIRLFARHGMHHRTELLRHVNRLSRHLAEGLLEALEEMKPTSVVGVELLDVELGSSAPRILGIKVRPASMVFFSSPSSTSTLSYTQKTKLACIRTSHVKFWRRFCFNCLHAVTSPLGFRVYKREVE